MSNLVLQKPDFKFLNQSEKKLFYSIEKLYKNNLSDEGQIRELLFDLITYTIITMNEKNKFTSDMERLKILESMMDNHINFLQNIEKNEMKLKEKIDFLETELFTKEEKIINLQEKNNNNNDKFDEINVILSILQFILLIIIFHFQ